MERDTNEHSANPPRDVLRDGNLKSSIWRNEGEKGPFYSATLSRTYTDHDGQPRDSNSFAGTDLLRLSELARKTYDRTQDLRREDSRQQSLEMGDRPQGRDERQASFRQQRKECANDQSRSR